MQGSILTLTHPSFLEKKSYMAQNSLKLKLPSRSSPPFYAKTKNSLTQRKKMDIKIGYTQFPAGNFPHTCLYTLTLFLDKCSSSLIWQLPLLASLKVICSCKVPVSFFWTSPSLTPLPYIYPCQFYFGEGNGTPLQYSCLENPMDGGA